MKPEETTPTISINDAEPSTTYNPIVVATPMSDEDRKFIRFTIVGYILLFGAFFGGIIVGLLLLIPSGNGLGALGSVVMTYAMSAIVSTIAALALCVNSIIYLTSGSSKKGPRMVATASVIFTSSIVLVGGFFIMTMFGG